MEVVKKNGEITQCRSYEWDGYTPLGLIVKEKEVSGNFQTKTYQYITNQRGDVLSIRDQEDQEVGSYRYDAYGNVLSVEGDVAKDNPIRYAGYYYDEETKNYYLQARYYNPENGAFLALDPHPGDGEEPLSQNGYSYRNNNPFMDVDPNGLASMRTRDLALLINGVVAAIPQLRPVVKAMSSKAWYKLKNLLKKKTTKDKIIEATFSGLKKAGMKKPTAKQVAVNVINFILSVKKSSIGNYAVALLKKKLKT
ncbi:RHS repeat-associated core domain-containing protein [Rummeliibacillus sp. TYF005]|uniref:RHS repeat domain-containing protein n=1 Tax=Rummeliibacillus sp. TYF005 TaxID=2058214 RepID=UPI000F51DB26|nr:RHS repeat-associated core domain-containing protein [Rummeliibacillus sp. TYF005]RPJ93940.1 RHS repeat-associated core domain-containing protein [Rummeliibacillus sp. TYF005]